MSFFDFFFCSGCSNAPKGDITADVDITSLEILSINQDIISILLETKVGLNCTNYNSNDCLYLYSNPNKIAIKFKTLASQEFQFQKKIKLDLEEAGYSLLNKSELNIKAGIYNILYLRSSTYNNKYGENSDWKILGSSPAFKLDVVFEEKAKKNEGSSTKLKLSTVERTQNSQKTKQDDLENSQNYSKLKNELLENKSLNETFLPLKPKPLNLESYYNNATISKYKSFKRNEMKENKENNNPNFHKRNY